MRYLILIDDNKQGRKERLPMRYETLEEAKTAAWALIVALAQLNDLAIDCMGETRYMAFGRQGGFRCENVYEVRIIDLDTKQEAEQ